MSSDERDRLVSSLNRPAAKARWGFDLCVPPQSGQRERIASIEINYEF